MYGKHCMFIALFYPSDVKFYTDNVRASVANSMFLVGSFTNPAVTD